MPEQVSSLKTDVKYKDTPIGEIPVDWSLKSISGLCEILDHKRVPLNKEQREKMRGDIPYYGANGVIDYINDYIFDGDLILIAEDGGYFEEYKTRPIAYLIHGKSWVNNHAHILKVMEPNTLLWVFYSLVHKNIIPFIKGGTRSKLNQEDLRQILIPLPPLSEQKEASKVLATVDEAIEKTAQIIEKTKEVKKGLMQKLFTRGVWDQKLKKTEIGEIPGDWEVVRFKEITEKFYNGGTPDTKRKSYWGGDIPWVTGADFEGQKVKRIRRYITHEGLENSATNIIPKGNLLIVTRTGVGKMAIAPFDIAISQDITGVTLDSKKVLTGYIFWYLDYKSERLRSIIQGTSINGLLREDLELFVVPLPRVEEQNQIAENLFSIEGDIEEEINQKERLVSLKKGLMKVLLTGQVRVNV
jgi:type I restriction enzyme S subunit